MRRFVLKVILFGILTTLLSLFVYFIGDKITEEVYGPNTKTQIEESFNNALSSNASNWILGNSRIYRGLNPDVIENGQWYNFAHDNDSYNQMYYKMRYLLDHNCKIDTLVIGTDYFQFNIFSDTRNYVYDDLLGSEYIKDYTNCFVEEWLCNFKRQIITKQGMVPSALLFINTLVTGAEKKMPQLRKNGSYVNDMSRGKEVDFVERDSTMKDIQIKYYEKILTLCKAKHIELFVLMMPIRDNELKCYSSHFIERFNNYINESLESYGFYGRFLNMSNCQDFKDYRRYTDITHLNSIAADDYTRLFYKELNKRRIKDDTEINNCD